MLPVGPQMQQLWQAHLNQALSMMASPHMAAQFMQWQQQAERPDDLPAFIAHTSPADGIGSQGLQWKPRSLLALRGPTDAPSPGHETLEKDVGTARGGSDCSDQVGNGTEQRCRRFEEACKAGGDEEAFSGEADESGSNFP